MDHRTAQHVGVERLQFRGVTDGFNHPLPFVGDGRFDLGRRRLVGWVAPEQDKVVDLWLVVGVQHGDPDKARVVHLGPGCRRHLDHIVMGLHVRDFENGVVRRGQGPEALRFGGREAQRLFGQYRHAGGQELGRDPGVAAGCADDDGVRWFAVEDLLPRSAGQRSPR